MQIIQDLTTVNFTKGAIKQVRGIVIHSQDGFQNGTISWFKNPDSKASAHYCISKTGVIVQMVLDTDFAWHAGSTDPGKCPEWALPNPNYYTLGIELEDERNRNWVYPELQRAALRELIVFLMQKYNIPRERILLHRDINPSRRSDPLGQFSFNWLFPPIPSISPSTSTEKIPKDSVINDIYFALTGNYASAEEKKWRMESGKNLVEIMEDICAGDSRFFEKWVKPKVPILPEPPRETANCGVFTEENSRLKALLNSLTNLLYSAGFWARKNKQFKDLLPKK